MSSTWHKSNVVKLSTTFLFEHKSYEPEHPVQLQLLDYMLQLWEDDLRNSRPLSFIIPAVVYHGEKGWTQDSFFDYFSGMPEHWRAFLPDFRYWLTDLSAVSVEDIHAKIESEYLRNLFLALKLSRNAELARKNWKKIFTFGGVLENEVRAQMFFKTLTLYIYIVSGMSQGEIKTLSTQLSEAENSWVDAIPEIFGEKWKREGLRKGRRQGFKKGIEKGIEKGIDKGREEGLSEGLQKGIEKGIEKGREEAFEAIVKKIMLKFPQWSDAEVAAFLDAEEGYIKQLRRI